jgi:hypothetical protein
MTFEGLTVRNTSAEAFLFYYADDGEVRDCTTESVGSGVSFYFSSRGYVFRSNLQGGVNGKGAAGTIVEANEIHHSAAEGITLHDNSRDLRYLHNVVHDNHSVNIYVDSASQVVIDGNLIFTTGAPEAELAGIQMADESYEDVTGPVLADVVITNNVIVNTDYGIVFWEGYFPGQSAMRNVLIANNTVVDCASGAIVWDEGPHEGTQIRNNVSTIEAGGYFLLNAKSTEGVALDHNLWSMPGAAEPIVWGDTGYGHEAWVVATGRGAGDVTDAPGFVGPRDHEAASYALAEGSPAIDRGVEIAGLTVDFAGNLRPTGAAFHLGAFEFGAPPNPDGGPDADVDGPVDAGPDADGAALPDGDVGGADGGNGDGCGCRAASRARSSRVSSCRAGTGGARAYSRSARTRPWPSPRSPAPARRSCRTARSTTCDSSRARSRRR